ncbi:MAG: FAD-dependent oxidoreductase [Treponema sp.]|jgi:CxxC motif-containing protein/NADPH-dependent 2,4-dienoyl-CoA reductase/sulfur reductase-like enzyme|nr:FAD-dependent oxidoreductase [Treponema sp.]
MKRLRTGIAVIGAGPAGLAAALEAKRLGVEKTLLLERDFELGGILQQCIHDGFGIHRFGRRLSGSQYAQYFIDQINQINQSDQEEASGIDVLTETMVLEVTPDRRIFACNKQDGILDIECGAVILAMGCRERTAAQTLIYGDRPVGVLTAGAVQRYINMEGYLPGRTAVILGSGDIGLIMARRMTLEGIEVKGVYEVMERPGGLTRNIVQCLDDFGIPLHLSETVTAVRGRDRVEAVTTAKAGPDRKPIPGTEREVPCDLLVLAVGLIPENELSVKAGIALDPRTKGPALDSAYMTSVPGIFAAGNVAAVFDLVDYVSLSGEFAAQGASAFLKGELSASGRDPVEAGENVSFVTPQWVRRENPAGKTAFFLRVKEPAAAAELVCSTRGRVRLKRRRRHAAPPEMLSFELEPSGALLVEMRRDESSGGPGGHVPSAGRGGADPRGAETICIVCPNSCRLTVAEDAGILRVTGNECPRGEKYGIQEYRAPTRMLTTTVAVSGGTLPRLPVISREEIPKARINQCLQALYRIEVRAPIRCGDVIVTNICNTGVDVTASRSMKRKEG